ncbi:MAG: ABC transporter permease, partial [Oscillospiraceae bacterium]|nr:ABC transporter permease [Oscillospiraceae bacterium]
WVPAFVITLAFGAATGLINAFFVNGLKFVAFISTLAVSAVYGGLALVITNAQNIPIGNKSFISIGSINLLNTFPLPFVVMVILLVAYGVVLHFTGFGRRTYMVGGNASAARLAGINPKKITTILFVNNGVIASIAGLFFASRMNMGSPSAITGSDLDAVTAAVLGGIAFTGGAGNMFGVFIGIMLIISFQNGIVVVGLDSYYQVVSKGLLLVAALMMDYFREKSRLKALKEERG